MKPSEKYIEWLQAHPAVWEALEQEWEPSPGDWVWTGHEIGILLSGRCHDTELHSVFRKHSWDDEWSLETFARYQLDWLPTLGQLVRLLQHEWEDWANRLEVVMLKETAGNKGAKAMISPREPYLQPIESSEWEEEPEIAATALWAKVKGVE